MTILRTIQVALRSLLAHKMRSALTMLGIIIGTACVIAMVSMGDGAQERIQENMTRMGTNLLFVRPGSAQKGHVSVGGGTLTTLSVEDADAIAAEFRDRIADLAPEVGGMRQVKYFSRNVRTQILGTTPAYARVRNFPTQEGRYFTWDDLRLRRRVCVVGVNVAQKLFQGGSPVGQTVKIGGANFDVVGVLEEKGDNWMDPDDQVIVPLATAQRLIFGEDSLRAITIEARSTDLMERLQRDITDLLKVRHRIAPGEEPDFSVRNQQEFLDAVRLQVRMMTSLLAGVAAVSLIVGGIGIMNIMLVSVTERTREIGIRKALGATRGDILKQFLVEAIVISLIGGGIGIAAGAGASAAVARAADWGFILPFRTIGLAAGTSAAIGIVFGVFPAVKAAWLDPIEALRYE
jgi:putative ABC transport system permease protein